MPYRYIVVKTKLIFFPQLLFSTAAGGTGILSCHPRHTPGNQIDSSTYPHIPSIPNSCQFPLAIFNCFISLFFHLRCITESPGELWQIPWPHWRPFQLGQRHQWFLNLPRQFQCTSSLFLALHFHSSNTEILLINHTCPQPRLLLVLSLSTIPHTPIWSIPTYHMDLVVASCKKSSLICPLMVELRTPLLFFLGAL